MLKKILITASLFLVLFTTMFVSTGLVYAAEESNSFVLSGYVKPDLSSTEDIKSGFEVSIDGMVDSKGITDKNGYFEFTFKPNSNEKHKLLISKNGYLSREISDVEISSNISVGTINEPVEMWAGDVNQDDMINMSDVMSIAKTFNLTSSDDKFVQSYDFNRDSSINMAEVLVIAKHFNAIPSNYSKVNVKAQTSEYVQVVAGGDRTVGIKSDGTVWYGLGMEHQIMGLSNIKTVFIVDNYTILAVTKDDGRILKGYSNDEWKEYTNLKHVKKIVGTKEYVGTIILTEEGVVYKEVNNSNFEPIQEQLGGKKAIDIAQGNGHSLILMEDGTLYGFGLNDYGQLGIPKGEKVSEPVNLSSIMLSLTNIKAVAAFQDRSFVLKTDGSIWSWGKFDSSLGIGESSEEIIPPTKVIDNSGIKTKFIAASEHFLQAVKEDGSVWNCGDNIYYSLGIGDSRHIDCYKLIKNYLINNVNSISAGNNHVVVQKNDGSFWGWSNEDKLGIGDSINRNYPESVSNKRYSYFGRFLTGFDSVEPKVQINRYSTTDSIKPDFYIRLDGIFTAGDNLKLYGFQSDKENFSYSTNLEETIRLEIYNNRYIMTGPGSMGRNTISGNIPDRDLDMILIAEVPDIYDNRNIKLSLEVINMSNHKLTINMSDARNRVTVKNFSGDIDYGIHKYLYNPKSTKLTCSVPLDKKTAMIDVDYRFAGLTYDITQAEKLPGKAQIKVKENESVVKEYEVNFLEPANTYYSSTDGSIDYGGEVNMYYLDMEKYRKYKIFSTGNTDTLLEIRDEKFELVATNNDGGDGSNFNLSFTPNDTKTYTLIVKHFDGIKGTGKYNLCVEEEAAPSDVTTPDISADSITWKVTNAYSKSLSIYDNDGNFVTKSGFSDYIGTLAATGLKPETTYKAVLTDKDNNVNLITYAKTLGVITVNPPLTTSDYDAIIFIPGVGGSNLEWKLDTLNVILCGRTKMSSWPPEPDAHGDFLYSFMNLSCDPTGKPEKDTYENGILENFWGVQDICGNFISHLKSKFGGKTNICVFPYDWRLSVNVSASNLNSYIDSHGYKKVVLVAHSMGGLVATKYIEMGNSSNVKKLITFSTPYLGSPKMIDVAETGKFFGMFPLDLTYGSTIKKMVGNFASIYDLLPSQKYLDSNNGYYITNNNSCLTSMQDTKNFLNSRSWANTSLLNNGITFQNSLNYESNTDFASVDKYLIMGDSMPTIVGFKASDGNAMVEIIGNGDGTVPIISQNIGNLNIPNIHRYYVNSDHGTYNNTDAVKLFDNIIEFDDCSTFGSIHSAPENVKN